MTDKGRKHSTSPILLKENIPAIHRSYRTKKSDQRFHLQGGDTRRQHTTPFSGRKMFFIMI